MIAFVPKLRNNLTKEIDMTGKEKCRLLKAIRQEIAESNGIVYLTSECTYEGECRGTCPKCDAEIRYLDAEIKRLSDAGTAVTLAGISTATLDKALAKSRTSAIESFHYEDHDIIVEKGNLEPYSIDSGFKDAEKFKIKSDTDEMITMGSVRYDESKKSRKGFIR